MKDIFKITRGKIILAFLITISPIGSAILSGILSRLGPMTGLDQIPYVMTIARYFFNIIFFPFNFNILVGHYIQTIGMRLLGDSLYMGGTLSSFLFYFLYFLMQFAYSFILGSMILIFISQFQKNK